MSSGLQITHVARNVAAPSGRTTKADIITTSKYTLINTCSYCKYHESIKQRNKHYVKH